MPSTETRSEVSVALVYQAQTVQAYLSDALRELGANVVYETRTRDFERAVLDRSGARVVIVNFDPDNDEQIDAIDELLVDDQLKVVFNDGEATSKLSGYDLARWARHLASKIVGDSELLPPRPEGSEAVPVRSMPQHGLSSTSKPKSMDAPSVTDASMNEATEAIANALASFDMHATKIEAKNAPVAPSIDDLLGDFGLSSRDTPSASAANPFADLGLQLDMDAPAASSVPVAAPAANPFDDLTLDTTTAKSTGSETADALLAFADLTFDDPPEVPEAAVGLDDFLATHAPRSEVQTSVAASRAPRAEASKTPPIRSDLLEGLSFTLEPEDAEIATAAPVVAPSAPALDFAFNLDGLSLEPIDGAAAAPSAVGTPAKFGLPPELPSPAATKPAVAKSAAIDDVFAGLGLSLEPFTDDAVAVPIAPVAAAVSASPFADLDFNLDDMLDDSPVNVSVSTGQSDSAGTTGLEDLSFGLDETVELNFDAPTLAGSDLTESTDDEDAFMREFAAMSAGTSAANGQAAAATGPVTRVWVLGASIGGPDAVREFLSALPATVNATFVLAQHMGADFVDLMVAQLQKATKMPVVIATTGMRAAHGQVIVAPISERMLLDPSGEVRVVPPDEVSPYSPSIDRALIDVADRFGAGAGAIIFSGMAHDAIEGAKHLAAKGGTVWVQDPSTCVVSSMIDGAMDAGIVTFVGKPAELAAEFARRFSKN